MAASSSSAASFFGVQQDDQSHLLPPNSSAAAPPLPTHHQPPQSQQPLDAPPQKKKRNQPRTPSKFYQKKLQDNYHPLIEIMGSILKTSIGENEKPLFSPFSQIPNFEISKLA